MLVFANQVLGVWRREAVGGNINPAVRMPGLDVLVRTVFPWLAMAAVGPELLQSCNMSRV